MFEFPVLNKTSRKREFALYSEEEQWEYFNADAHHIKPLYQEGPDRLENMLCLCPSCHRRFHTKEYKLLTGSSKLGCEDVVLQKRSEVATKHPIKLFGTP